MIPTTHGFCYQCAKKATHQWCRGPIILHVCKEHYAVLNDCYEIIERLYEDVRRHQIGLALSKFFTELEENYSRARG